MDLASLKNLDVKDILGKIKGDGLADILKNKKLLIKFGIVGGSILILLIIYSFFVKPKIDVQKAQINIMNENKIKTFSINDEFILKEEKDNLSNLANMEMKYLGFYLSAHPVNMIIKKYQLNNRITKIINLNHNILKPQNVLVVIDEIKIIKDKKYLEHITENAFFFAKKILILKIT